MHQLMVEKAKFPNVYSFTACHQCTLGCRQFFLQRQVSQTSSELGKLHTTLCTSSHTTHTALDVHKMWKPLPALYHWTCEEGNSLRVQSYTCLLKSKCHYILSPRKLSFDCSITFCVVKSLLPIQTAVCRINNCRTELFQAELSISDKVTKNTGFAESVAILIHFKQKLLFDRVEKEWIKCL